MKLIKSLLLGSAAGLVAVSGAYAADLGAKKPTAVEYVKTCPTYGAGFFVIPGTNNCLKLVGRVRADYIVDNNQTRAGNHNRVRARGYVGFDHRTATEYGLLRTYMRAFFQVQNGANSTTLEYAFVQFGGFTFGRVAPIYEHGWSQFYFGSGQGSSPYHSDISYSNAIGYTFNAGGGLSLSVSLDDPSDRARVIGGGSAGKAMPDLTAAIVYDQSWGTIRIAGAMFQLRAANAAVDTKYGFATEAGVKINLPMLSRGSNIWVSGSYSEGGNTYGGWHGGSVGSFTITQSDALLVAGNLKLTKAASVFGALQYFVMPTVSVSVGGFWGQIDPAGAANTIRSAGVVGQIAWNPAPGFLIGLEAMYRNVSFGSAAIVTNSRVGVGLAGKKDEVVGRLRVQRDF